MADFYQNGIITTLHNIADRPIEALEEELISFSKQRPMGLIPVSYTHLRAHETDSDLVWRLLL